MAVSSAVGEGFSLKQSMIYDKGHGKILLWGADEVGVLSTFLEEGGKKSPHPNVPVYHCTLASGVLTQVSATLPLSATLGDGGAGQSTPSQPRNTLFLVDSGGQLEFQEILTAITPPVSIVATAVKNLSRAHLEKNLRRVEHMIPEQCKLIIIGTHQDSDKASNRGENLTDPSFISNRLIPFSSSEVVFPTFADEDYSINKVLSKKLEAELFPCALAKIPGSWNILLPALQTLAVSKGAVAISFEEGLELAQKYGFAANSLQCALTYFSRNRVLLYLNDVVPDVIFTNPFALLSIVFMIVCAVKNKLFSRFFKGVELGSSISEAAINVKCLSDVQFEEYYRYCLTPKTLLDVLERMMIVSRVNGNETYFMPCLLPALQDRQIATQIKALGSQRPLPLAIHFQNTVLPGIYPLLVSSLLALKASNASVNLKRNKKRVPMCVFKNCVSFSCSFDNVTINMLLIERELWYELHVNPSAKGNAPLLCGKVHNIIHNSIRKAANILQYGNVEPQDAFVCPCNSGSGPHLAIPDPLHLEMKCTVNSSPYPMETKHLVWMGKLSSKPHLPELIPIPLKEGLWFKLGKELKLNTSVLDSLHEGQSNDYKRRKAMFKAALESTPHISWADIIKALSSIGESDLAQDVEKEYGLTVKFEATQPETRRTATGLQALEPQPSAGARQTKTAVIQTSTSQSSSLPVSPSLEKFANYLKNVYSSMQVPTLQHKGPHSQAHTYVNLTLIRKDVDQLPNVFFKTPPLSGDVNQDRNRAVEIDDLFRMAGKNVVLVEGAPGTGKTTLSHEVCRRWGSGHLADYQAVLLFNLADPSVRSMSSLDDMLTVTAPPGKSLLGLSSLDIPLFTGANMLLILDGFDELSASFLSQQSFLTDMIQGVVLGEASVLVTSRPASVIHLQSLLKGGAQQYHYYELIGFNNEQLQEYLSHSMKENDPFLQNLPCFPEIQEMMTLPLMAAVICVVSTGMAPLTITLLYKQLLLRLLTRYVNQVEPRGHRPTHFEDINELPQPFLSQFHRLCELSRKGIDEMRDTFMEDKDFPHLGLMDSRCPSPIPEPPSLTYRFLHLSLQEFLAALHLSNTLSVTEVMPKLKESLKKGLFQKAWPFYAGLTKLTCVPAEELRAIIASCGEDSAQQSQNIIISCLHESQNAQLVRSVTNQVQPLQVSVCSPAQSYALVYCINESSCLWEVSVKEGNTALQVLTTGIRSHARIRALNLSRCNLASLHPLLLVNRQAVRKLSELTLDHNCLTPASCSELAELVPSLSSLASLSLCHNPGIGGRMSPLLAALQMSSSLRELLLGHTGLTEEDLAVLLGALLMSARNLRRLDVSGNRLTPGHAVSLGNALERNNSLEALDLSTCSLCDDGVMTLASALVVNTSLLQLNLSHNPFGQIGFQALAETLNRSDTLKLLTLKGFQFDSVQFLQGLRKNWPTSLELDPVVEAECRKTQNFGSLLHTSKMSVTSFKKPVPSLDRLSNSPLSDLTRSSTSTSFHSASSLISFDEPSIPSHSRHSPAINAEATPPFSLVKPHPSSVQPSPRLQAAVMSLSPPPSTHPAPRPAPREVPRHSGETQHASPNMQAGAVSVKTSAPHSPFATPEQTSGEGSSGRQVPSSVASVEAVVVPNQASSPLIPHHSHPGTSSAHPDMASPLQRFCDTVKELNVEAVKEVLGAGAEGGGRGGGGREVDVDVVISDKDGHTALMLAAVANKPELVRLLLKYKASTTARDKDGFTALHLACSHGNYEVMKMLVGAFADVNSMASDGTPLLLKPAQRGFSMVTQYLLENGADPNIADKNGVTPLIAASIKGQRDVVKVLLSSGADASAVSLKSSRNALQEAIEKDHQEIVPLLMRAMAEAREKSQGLFTCKTGEVVARLLQERARVDERRGDEATPLMVQVELGNEEVVKELLRHSANVDLQDKNGMSALMRAAMTGQLRMVQLLLSHRSILDLKSKSGYTALMYSVQRGHVRVARELLLAGADPTARDKNGVTVVQLSRKTGNREMVEELEKHTAAGDPKDPFIHLLSGYLDKFSVKKKEQKTAPATASLSHHLQRAPLKESPATSSKGGDENSTLREELNRAWKRIADLETRVQDLTVTSTLELPEETDLSYLDRGRLETEFRKLKEMKKKAEQYAVEAKQTAQRLSAENYKLREDLSREHHLNELERKNMLREMEQQLARTSAMGEWEGAMRETMDEEIERKARTLAQGLPQPLDLMKMPKVAVSPQTLKSLIFSQTVRANLLLVAAGGLPFSGKSSLVKALLGLDSPTDPHGLTVYDAIFLHDQVNHTWRASRKEEAELLAATEVLMQVSLRRHEMPYFSSTPDLDGATSLFGDQQIDAYFAHLFVQLGKYTSDLGAESENTLRSLLTSKISFLNVWDVGVNRGVYEVLSRLAPQCSRMILLNTFSLTEDANSMETIPQLSDSRYEGRYEERGDHRSIMRLQTKLQYLFYPLCVCPPQEASTLLVGTHDSRSLSREEVRERSEHVLKTMKVEAEYHGRAHCLVPSVVAVDSRNAEDVTKLKMALEKMIEQGNQYEYDLPLSWIFLRCFLAHTKKLYVTLPELIAIAKKCSISAREVHRFLEVFGGCGSLIYISNLCPECADEYVVLRPSEFLLEIDKLYYVHIAKGADGEPLNIPDDPQHNHKVGCVSTELAWRLWSKGGKDEETYCFLLHSLRRLSVLAAKKQGMGTLRDTTMYFMPSIRCDLTQTSFSPHSTSLFLILHSFLLSFSLLSEFLMHFQAVSPWHVVFERTTTFNTVTFTWKEKAKFHISFMGGYVEISIDCTHLDKPISFKEHVVLCSMLKSECIQVMYHIQTSYPELGLQYSMAIMCPHRADPNGNGTGQDGAHLIECHPLQDEKEVYCHVCRSVVRGRGGSGGEGGTEVMKVKGERGGEGVEVSEGEKDGEGGGKGESSGGDIADRRMLWLQAPYTGPLSLVRSASDTLLPSEAESLADELCTLDPESFSSLAVALGLPQLEEEEEGGRGEEGERKKRILSCSSQRSLLLGHLLVYDRSTPYHARRRLARLLLGQGLLRQALKLDPSALEWCCPPPPAPLTMTELTAVSAHLTRWEEVGERLRVPADIMEQLKSSPESEDKSYELLCRWRKERERREGEGGIGERQILITALRGAGCVKAAEFLELRTLHLLWQ